MFQNLNVAMEAQAPGLDVKDLVLQVYFGFDSIKTE